MSGNRDPWMLVWLDDTRPVPYGFTHWVKTADEAIDLLKTGEVSFISLDHDLGLMKTGYDVVLAMEEGVLLHGWNLPKWNVHSANPVGCQRMTMVLRKLEEAVDRLNRS